MWQLLSDFSPFHLFLLKVLSINILHNVKWTLAILGNQTEQEPEDETDCLYNGMLIWLMDLDSSELNCVCMSLFRLIGPEYKM